MNEPLQQYTYLGQTVILRPGHRFTKKQLISRLHEMDVQFDQTVEPKIYYIDLYENALKYDVNRKKIFNQLIQDTILYNKITNSKILNNQNIIETPPKDNVKKVSIINNRVINENDLSNRQKININNNNEYEFISNNNNQENNYPYKQTPNIQYNNNNNNNMIKTNRFNENNNQNNNQYTFRDAIANEIKKTEINLQNQNNFQNIKQNKNQNNNNNSYYNIEQNKTFMNQSNQNYEQRRNINYNQSNNYMNNQSNNISSEYNKINQSNYGTSEMPKNYNSKPNQLSYNQQNYEHNKQNNIQQNFFSQSQQQNYMQNQNHQNNNRMNQNNNYTSQNQINQNYPTFNSNYSNQNSQNTYMNNESKYSSKDYSNQSQQNFNNNMKTNISNNNININQYDRKNIPIEGGESNRYYNQTQKYNNINPISLSIQNAVNDNNQNSQMTPNPNNSEDYQNMRNNRRPILTNNMSVIDESDGEDSQSNFSIVSNIDRIKNYFNNKENRDYCYNILLVIICAFLLFIIFSYGLRFSRTIYGKGTEVIETITNPRRLFIDLIWGLIKGIIVGILWDYVFYTIPFVVLSFVIYKIKEKYVFEQTCKKIVEDIKNDLRNKPSDNNGRRTISENEIISRYSKKYNIDRTIFINKYLKKLSTLRSKDGSLKEFKNINNQGVIINYWELNE